MQAVHLKLFPDMGRCAITRGRQALELRSNLSERRSLTDQIQISECSASYSARNLQWAVAHGTLSLMMKYAKVITILVDYLISLE